MSPNDTYPEQVVTAVIVAHDGAQWLPDVTQAVLEQTHQVHRVVAVDTGSRDRSGAVLAELLGPAAVFGMDRETGYGAAVAQALRHPAANTPAGGGQAEWIWLLHDDCAPAPDALEELLRGAVQTPNAAVLGPKVLDWSDRQVILEAGLAIDTAGRRISGTEPREIDQGQHDGDRDVLAVGSAGMLVQRDVWDEVGGFDVRYDLFREDVDFCWRVHAAGHRVRLITDSVVYHVEASARGRRQISATAHPRRTDRRNALFALLANLPLPAMFAALCGNTALSAARIFFFLLAKRPAAARDEAAALGFVFGHPGLLIVARRRRPPGRRRAYGALRSQVPRGRSVRKLAEFAAGMLSRTSPSQAVGMHHASDDPSDDDSLLIDTGLGQRIFTNPGVILLAALTVITLVAERSLLGGGPLGGGALLPAWGGASGLWGEYLSGFHAVGIGSAASTPPYIAVLAALSTILGGKPWLAVDVIMIGCVPLSGLTAYLTARRVTSHASVRVLAAATYALLPVATGAVAAGRLGTAVVFVLMPLIAATAGRMLTRDGRRARRAAWATGLLIAVAAAFVPLVWVLAVIIAAFAGLAFGRSRRALAVNLAIVALVPPVLLAPWTVQVAGHPSGLLLEAGLQQSGLASRNLPASSLMLLAPGGPGTPPIWITGGLIAAALAALLLRGRWLAVAAAWGVVLSGLLIGIAVSRVLVSPPGGGPAVPAWPGVAMLFAAVGLLLAVAAAGDTVHALLAAGGTRRIAAMAAAIAACSTPVLAAGFWVINGVNGPLSQVAGPVLPEFVSVSSQSALHLRTLVLRPGRTSVSYSVLRGTEPPIGSAELAEPAPAGQALARVVAGLATPGGSSIGNEGQALAQFAIGYVLLPAPIDARLARLLDGVTGLRPVSETPAFELWRVSDTVARVRVTEPGGAQVALPSGSVNATNVPAPVAGGTVVLAEPVSGGWHATLNGRPLTSLASPVGGWAQGFRLPPGGGRLSITRGETGRLVAVALELAALIVVAVLALPGAKVSAAEAGHAARSSGKRGVRSRDAGPPGPSGPSAPPGPRRSPRGGRRRRAPGEEDAGSRREMAPSGRHPSRIRSRGKQAQRDRSPEPAVPDGRYRYRRRPVAPAEEEYPRRPAGDEYARSAADREYPQADPEEQYSYPEPGEQSRYPEPDQQYGRPEPDEQYGRPEPGEQSRYPEPDEQYGRPEPGEQSRYPEPDQQYGRPEPDSYQYPYPEPDQQSGSAEPDGQYQYAESNDLYQYLGEEDEASDYPVQYPGDGQQAEPGESAKFLTAEADHTTGEFRIREVPPEEPEAGWMQEGQVSRGREADW